MGFFDDLDVLGSIGKTKKRAGGKVKKFKKELKKRGFPVGKKGKKKWIRREMMEDIARDEPWAGTPRWKDIARGELPGPWIEKPWTPELPEPWTPEYRGLKPPSYPRPYPYPEQIRPMAGPGELYMYFALGGLLVALVLKAINKG